MLNALGAQHDKMQKKKDTKFSQLLLNSSHIILSMQENKRKKKRFYEYKKYVKQKL